MKAEKFSNHSKAKPKVSGIFHVEITRLVEFMAIKVLVQICRNFMNSLEGQKKPGKSQVCKNVLVVLLSGKYFYKVGKEVNLRLELKLIFLTNFTSFTNFYNILLFD